MLTIIGRVRITSTGFSSQRFGDCEQCHKHASEVYLLSGATYIMSGKVKTWAACFGHYDCMKLVELHRLNEHRS